MTIKKLYGETPEQKIEMFSRWYLSPLVNQLFAIDSRVNGVTFAVCCLEDDEPHTVRSWLVPSASRERHWIVDSDVNTNELLRNPPSPFLTWEAAIREAEKRIGMAPDVVDPITFSQAFLQYCKPDRLKRSSKTAAYAPVMGYVRPEQPEPQPYHEYFLIPEWGPILYREDAASMSPRPGEVLGKLAMADMLDELSMISFSEENNRNLTDVLRQVEPYLNDASLQQARATLTGLRRYGLLSTEHFTRVTELLAILDG